MRQRPASSVWLLTGVTAIALVLGAARVASPQFTSFSSDPRTILEGNWQSCREPGGQYSERVYDHVVDGGGRFELHLGPRHEFALFMGVQDEHRAHDSPDNLLKPYRVTVEGNQARQQWIVPSLDLVFTVTLAGGSRTECESWFVVLEPRVKTSD